MSSEPVCETLFEELKKLAIESTDFPSFLQKVRAAGESAWTKTMQEQQPESDTIVDDGVSTEVPAEKIYEEGTTTPAAGASTEVSDDALTTEG